MRHFIGLVAASIAAPYLVMFLGVFVHPVTLGLWLRDPAVMLGILALPAYEPGLIYVTIPLLFLAALLAMFLNSKGWQAWWRRLGWNDARNRASRRNHADLQSAP